jgi:hypothetical protein
VKTENIVASLALLAVFGEAELGIKEKGLREQEHRRERKENATETGELLT